MTQKVIIAAILLVATHFGLEDKSVVVNDLDFTNVFVDSSTKSHDALLISGYFKGLADAIERDGQLSEPIISTGLQLQQVRLKALQSALDGWQISSQYPSFGKVAGKYLDANAGIDNGNLTKDTRSKWVKAFNDLSVSCKRIAE